MVTRNPSCRRCKSSQRSATSSARRNARRHAERKEGAVADGAQVSAGNAMQDIAADVGVDSGFPDRRAAVRAADACKDFGNDGAVLGALRRLVTGPPVHPADGGQLQLNP
jgi:hypothetical protein